MDEELRLRFTDKMIEVGKTMATFAATADTLSKTTNPLAVLMLMLKTGEQARTLADRLFEYSELVEELKNLGQ